jgi:hypothetical protein
MEKENNLVTNNGSSFINVLMEQMAIIGLTLIPLIYTYFVGMIYDVTAIGFLLFNIIAIAFAFATALNYILSAFAEKKKANKEIEWLTDKDSLFILFPFIPLIITVVLMTAMVRGEESRAPICKSIKGSEQEVCMKNYKIFKYSDDQMSGIVKDTNDNYDAVQREQNNIRLLDNPFRSFELSSVRSREHNNSFKVESLSDWKPRIDLDAPKPKSDSKREPINININLTINIPSVDLKINPSSNKNIDIDVTKPVGENSIRQLMEENIISHDNDQIDDDFRFKTIQNQIKNDLELRKSYILEKEMLKHKLEEIKHKNKSLENMKQDVMPYLFREQMDNRFRDR